jgi:hypothetical protein
MWAVCGTNVPFAPGSLGTALSEVSSRLRSYRPVLKNPASQDEWLGRKEHTSMQNIYNDDSYAITDACFVQLMKDHVGRQHIWKSILDRHFHLFKKSYDTDQLSSPSIFLSHTTKSESDKETLNTQPVSHPIDRKFNFLRTIKQHVLSRKFHGSAYLHVSLSSLIHDADKYPHDVKYQLSLLKVKSEDERSLVFPRFKLLSSSIDLGIQSSEST